MLERILLGLIRLYQVGVSPWTPSSCRFQPTCSAFAHEAIERHGAWRGSLLAVRRLSRCHPWGGMGYDPVPPPRGDAPIELRGDGTPSPGQEEERR